LQQKKTIINQILGNQSLREDIISNWERNNDYTEDDPIELRNNN
jgi:hypothetical protein